MKTRTDFVSNSSSCSFIISAYPERMKTLSKDIAKACIDKNDECHDPNLAERNKKILDFCFDHFQLAYLGDLVLESKKETYDFNFWKNKFFKYDSEEIAKKDFERTVKMIKLSKKKPTEKLKNDLDYISAQRCYKNTDIVNADGSITLTHDTEQYGFGVTNDIMRYSFYRFYSRNAGKKVTAAQKKQEKETRKKRCEAIFEMAKYMSTEKTCYSSPDIYQITQDSINNTLDLLAEGYEINGIGKNKKEIASYIKKYQDILNKGEKIFYIRQAHDGDGYGDFYIYTENTFGGINKVDGIHHLDRELL